MAFTDPVTLTVGGVAKVLPRVGVGDFNSRYQIADGTLKFSAGTTYGRRTRSIARVDYSTLVSSPEIPSTNNPVSMSAYLIVDRNAVGLTQNNLNQYSLALLDYLSASSGANLALLLSGQS